MFVSLIVYTLIKKLKNQKTKKPKKKKKTSSSSTTTTTRYIKQQVPMQQESAEDVQASEYSFIQMDLEY